MPNYSQLYKFDRLVKWVGDRGGALFFCRCTTLQLRGDGMLFVVKIFHCAKMICLVGAVDVHLGPSCKSSNGAPGQSISPQLPARDHVVAGDAITVIICAAQVCRLLRRRAPGCVGGLP